MSTLYLNYFGLNSPPFSITPDPGFFFEGKDKGVFIAGLLHAALQADGIVLVIGEVGSGKTMMSRLLLMRLPENVDTVYLPNPSFSRDEIIDVIARDLGIATGEQTVRLEVLQQELIKRHAQGRQVVVLVDEAHSMPAESIEEIRRLSNLETDDRKLVQLILCGQPELDTLLAAPHLRQVRDRVVYRLILRNLSQADSRAYLDHRLRVAGWRGGRMFTSMGERLLLKDAKGRARRLNLIADKALLAAFAEGEKQVNARHVMQAIRDVGANFSSAGSGAKMLTIAAWLLSMILTAAATIWIAGMVNKREAVVALPAKPPATHAQPEKSAAPQGAGRNVAHLSAVAKVAAKQQTSYTANVELDQLVKQSYLNAQKQANLGSYAIRLSSVQQESEVSAFIAVAGQTLSAGQIYVRQYYADNAIWYVIYFGNLPTLEAANQVFSGLATELSEAKPIIRTWKEILDAPWSL